MSAPAGRQGEPPAPRLFGAVVGVANAMLTLMVLAILFQVVARYVFARPPFWTEELARYAMIWCGMLGAALAFWRGVDPRFVEPGVVFRSWPRAAAALALVPAFIFAGAILYESLLGPGRDPARGFIGRNLTRTSEALEVNMALIAAAVPAMALLILVAGVLRLAKVLRGGPL